MKKFFIMTGLCAIAVFLGLQFSRPDIENPTVTGDLQAPEEIKSIMVRACYDCHSNQSNIRWYDKIQPIYWKVAEDISRGRAGLNFSTWDKLAPPDRKAKLWEAVNQIESGAMPIKSYQLVHPETRITQDELASLKSYLLDMVHEAPNDTAKLQTRDNQLRHKKEISGADNPVALNGVKYINNYKNWQIISISDRFDNGTMRVIYGNDIAVEAVKEKHINPWPEGTVFAKVAWDKLKNESGDITSGAFRQVELMIKNSRKYSSTHGWGFARFKTPQLIPYGKTALFATECINCHKPMKDNDFVFTFPIKN